MASEFFRALRAEIYKSRHSFAVWLSLAGTVANVVIFFTVSLWTTDWPALTANPWHTYITGHFSGIAFMMLPLYVVILASLVTYQEHQAGMWSQLFTLPFSRGQIFLSKLVFIILLFIAAHLLFITGMLFSGVVAGLVLPETQLLRHAPDPELIGRLAGKTVVSILGLLAFQYWISLRFRHFIVPLTVGILGFVGVSIMGPDWPGNLYIFFAYPIQYMPDLLEEIPALPRWGPLMQPEWLSLGYFVAFTLVGYLDIRRLDLF